ncbi:ferredoxin [Jatrophihabitans fulvus]
MTALQIDWHRCDGHGLCAALLPGVVRLDEWGFPVLPDGAVPDAALADARRAAAACPALALRLEPAPSAPSRKATR